MQNLKVINEDCNTQFERICLSACIPSVVELQLFEENWQARGREFNWCESVAIDFCVKEEELKIIPNVRAVFNAYENACQGVLISKDTANNTIRIDLVNNKLLIFFDEKDTCCFSGRAALLEWNLILISQDNIARQSSKGSLFISPSAFGLMQEGQKFADVPDNLLLNFVQGKDFHRKFFWKTADGNAIDFTGATAKLQVRDKLPADGGIVLFEALSGAGQLSVLPDGQVVFDILPTVTSGMVWKYGIWELEVYLPNNTVKYLQGKASVSPEIVL